MLQLHYITSPFPKRLEVNMSIDFFVEKDRESEKKEHVEFPEEMSEILYYNKDFFQRI